MDKDQKDLFDFAYNLSGTLRRQLSELYSASHTLLDGEKREDDPILDGKAAAFDKQYFAMVRLMENLSDVRYLDMGALLPLQYGDLVTLVGDVCQKSQSASGRTIVFRCPEAKVVWGMNVKGIERALYHLLSNSLKFSQDAVEVHLSQQQGQVVLSVTDSGCGMDEKAVAAALALPKPTDVYTAVNGGFGLGLPIVQAIAAHHGGTMTIDSQRGKGTTVQLYLPKTDRSKICVGDVEAMPYITKSGFNPTLIQLADALPSEAFCLRNQG
ncbi:HAMP domain-containing sensor histidine kinase [Bengtsoniella intestinalis]|uniref:sensor histidine kinase n=1 Tax=Bengtsoniella intestinalis TaxID=3073143 RepID=UPI00391F819F